VNVEAEGLGNWKRSSYCGDLRLADEGREVTVMGWVHTRRDHGGLIFVDLRDRAGVVQIVFNPERSQAAFELAQDLRNESVLAVRGRVGRRDWLLAESGLDADGITRAVRDAVGRPQARAVS